MPVKVFAIPALDTNYIWILREESDAKTYVIDPSQAEPVESFLKTRGWELDAILNTHHHHDHIGGNLELKTRHQCPVYGFKQDSHRIPGIDIQLSDRETLQLGRLQAQILFIPGHTHGQIAYYFETEKIVFVGDTLFNMGCGRLFEGTPEELYQSLQTLAKLPAETKVYCGHEYGLQNAAFAETYLGHLPEVVSRKKHIEELRQQGLPTVPFTLSEELKTNPFLNCHDKSLRQKLGLEAARDVDVFSRLRKLKDNF